MDSVTQITLGSAVGIAVMGHRTPLWKSALVGALCGTLPDLDFLIDYSDPIGNMTYHRGFSHSVFYLSLLSPLLAWLSNRLDPSVPSRRWWLAVWLILTTHVLLDALTIYGTQLLQPFTDHPFGVGSVFIIDPLYTLPLLLGIALTLWRHRLRWNKAGLLLGGLYLVWGLAVQTYVQTLADRSLADQGKTVDQVLVLPTTVNSLVWRIVAINQNEYLEGFYALADRGRPIEFRTYPRGYELYRSLRNEWGVKRMADFTKAFFKMQERNGDVLVTDLRMGQEPYYSFNFVVAERRGQALEPVDYRLEMQWPPLGSSLRWLWKRAKGHRIPPPWLDDTTAPGSEAP